MLIAVIQWTIEFTPEYSHGHPCLHKRIGYVYWSGNWLKTYIIILFNVQEILQNIYIFRI